VKIQQRQPPVKIQQRQTPVSLCDAEMMSHDARCMIFSARGNPAVWKIQAPITVKKVGLSMELKKGFGGRCHQHAGRTAAPVYSGARQADHLY
jgi:hypothetical protein